MASGTPCIVPFWEKKELPSTNNSVGARYLLISMVANGGQSLLI